MCTQQSGARADESKAKRLATAMSLYSDSLSGVVLTVDNRLSSYTGIKKQFASLCEKVSYSEQPSVVEQGYHFEPH